MTQEIEESVTNIGASNFNTNLGVDQNSQNVGLLKSGAPKFVANVESETKKTIAKGLPTGQLQAKTITVQDGAPIDVTTNNPSDQIHQNGDQTTLVTDSDTLVVGNTQNDVEITTDADLVVSEDGDDIRIATTNSSTGTGALQAVTEDTNVNVASDGGQTVVESNEDELVVSVQDGAVVVETTGGDIDVNVEQGAVVVQTGSGEDVVTVDTLASSNSSSGESDSIILTGGGDDVVYGGFSDDDIFGQSGNDALYGSFGNDTVSGGQGNDYLDGGWGDDIAFGGEGNDEIDGGFGNDTVSGGQGHDRVYGGTGNDKLSGDAGNDIIDGEIGNDEIDGGQGDDILDGGDGADKIKGGLGIDELFGGRGSDRLYGNEGDDYIEGESGSDLIDGGDGDDLLVGGTGNDTLIGGAGNDILDPGNGQEVVFGGEGYDTLVLAGGVEDYSFYERDDGRLVAERGANSVIFGQVEAIQFDDDQRFEIEDISFSDIQEASSHARKTVGDPGEDFTADNDSFVSNGYVATWAYMQGDINRGRAYRQSMDLEAEENIRQGQTAEREAAARKLQA